MEYRIANWITTVVTGSYIAGIMFLALIWLVVAIVSGDFEILLSSTTHKWFFWGGLYIFSLYLIGTLKEKKFRRRIISWGFSILFHLALLTYVALELKAGIAAFVVGIPESIIAVLSCIGLVFCIRSSSSGQA